MRTRSLRRTFHNDPKAAWSARRALGELRGEISPQTYETLSLLVSEVITNAVRHALCGPGTHVRLEVVASPAIVRAEICDRGLGFDPSGVAPPDAERVGGWGLYLLEELSDLWGVVHDEERGWTRVWFELENHENGASPDDERRGNGRVHRLPASVARLTLALPTSTAATRAAWAALPFRDVRRTPVRVPDVAPKRGEKRTHGAQIAPFVRSANSVCNGSVTCRRSGELLLRSRGLLGALVPLGPRPVRRLALAERGVGAAVPEQRRLHEARRLSRRRPSRGRPRRAALQSKLSSTPSGRERA